MHIVEALPHMHKMGVGFTAGVTGGPLDGQSFLESKGYDPDKGVLVQYSPAVDLSGVDGITFACTWNNTTDATLTYGIGLNEMCMMFGYAYPISATYSALAGSNACVMTTVPQ
jgi:hypothetical protein